ncbi:MAG: DUF3575 domain-containing protein [Cyclobacteriaceae bacterium]|nr:DUF3575 domain-containing protein [Cyclobacteriaceae bacterium]
MKTVIICCITALLLSNEIFAQNSGRELTSPSGTEIDGSNWSMETSLTFPLVRIYMLKFSYQHSDRVELGIGPAFQNWRNEEESFRGQSNAFTLVMSYRYYFWRTFNFEIELWPAWNRFESYIDNNTYKGFELWAEYKVGYRLDLGNRFYLNLQPGIGHALWLQNKWPGVQDDNYWDFVKDSVIFVPQALVAIRF